MVGAWAMALAGCTAAPRIPYTQQEQSVATVPGIPGARIWADDPSIALGRRSVVTRVPVLRPIVLALSGGGADGAFGAGLLTGWSARGTRPQFTIVTGASAGALIAPFAFLGPTYDQTLRNVFASGEMANLLQSDFLAGLFGTSLFKTAPLQELIARHVDATMLAAIAQQYRAGRRLYIVTTNLDAQRTAIWDMGKIAASGDPRALDLFRNVLTASASIPGVFSPVLIDVEAQGQRFAEMHVDGGVTNNVLIVPEAVLLSGTPLFPSDARPKVYIVMNGKLSPDFEVVKASTLNIVTRSFETSVRANTRNTLLASYQFMKGRNWEFNLASIDPSYPKPTSIGFDSAYMQQLFDYGYQRGRSGILWQTTPAGMEEAPRSTMAGR
jgi:predicted acylesterase/phospholipase RssA